MQVFLNGRFIPEAQALVPLSDRGFLYGDGLFETLRVSNGRPIWWSRHWERFETGATSLRIPLPWPSTTLHGFACELVQQNAMSEGVLRVTLSRGSSQRGYSPKGASQPTLAMTSHPLPAALPAVRLITASLRISALDPVANFKTANKLVQVMAHVEADDRGVDEALLVNTDGHVAEACASNLFWIEGGAVCTPPLSDGALFGITRRIVLEICRARAVPAKPTAHIQPQQLFGVDGVFLTNSVSGIVPASELDGRPLKQSPLTADLAQWHQEAQAAEASTPGPG
jgi:branched-chain amino acid aminotransferase